MSTALPSARPLAAWLPGESPPWSRAAKQRELAEAYEEGLRKGRAQVYDDWWDDVAIFNDPLDQLNKKGPKTRQIPLPAGEYESVPYHNRTYEFLVSPKNNSNNNSWLQQTPPTP